jgi:hypothetical protein
VIISANQTEKLAKITRISPVMSDRALLENLIPMRADRLPLCQADCGEQSHGLRAANRAQLGWLAAGDGSDNCPAAKLGPPHGTRRSSGPVSWDSWGDGRLYPIGAMELALPRGGMVP